MNTTNQPTVTAAQLYTCLKATDVRFNGGTHFDCFLAALDSHLSFIFKGVQPKSHKNTPLSKNTCMLFVFTLGSTKEGLFSRVDELWDSSYAQEAEVQQPLFNSSLFVNGYNNVVKQLPADKNDTTITLEKLYSVISLHDSSYVYDTYLTEMGDYLKDVWNITTLQPNNKFVIPYRICLGFITMLEYDALLMSNLIHGAFGYWSYAGATSDKSISTITGYQLMTIVNDTTDDVSQRCIPEQMAVLLTNYNNAGNIIVSNTVANNSLLTTLTYPECIDFLTKSLMLTKERVIAIGESFKNGPTDCELKQPDVTIHNWVQPTPTPVNETTHKLWGSLLDNQPLTRDSIFTVNSMDVVRVCNMALSEPHDKPVDHTMVVGRMHDLLEEHPSYQGAPLSVDHVAKETTFDTSIGEDKCAVLSLVYMTDEFAVYLFKSLVSGIDSDIRSFKDLM